MYDIAVTVLMVFVVVAGLYLLCYLVLGGPR